MEDNNLPRPGICLSCHTGAQGQPARLAEELAIKQPAATNLTRFNHRQHLRLGIATARIIGKAIATGAYLSKPVHPEDLNDRNACAGCHRGLTRSDQVTKANLPQMADCLVCHPKIDPPFSCAACHTEGPHLKPANHTPGWVDLHSSGKANLDKPSCAVCHGRKFTCLGCH